MDYEDLKARTNHILRAYAHGEKVKAEGLKDVYFSRNGQADHFSPHLAQLLLDYIEEKERQ